MVNELVPGCVAAGPRTRLEHCLLWPGYADQVLHERCAKHSGLAGPNQRPSLRYLKGNMNEPNDKSLVCKALVAAQAEMPAAIKDSENPFLHNRYPSLGAVTRAYRPVLAKHKLAILQVAESNPAGVTVNTSLVHESGQTLVCGSLFQPIGEERGKSRAQVAGSIITYLRRYAICTVLGIYADEDTDGNGEGTEQTHAEHAQHAPEPAPAPATKYPDEGLHKFIVDGMIKGKGAAGVKALEHFLQVKGWITKGQDISDWPKEQLPRYSNLAQKLCREFNAFYRTQTEQEAQ